MDIFCNNCNKSKPTEDFYVDNTSKRGFQYMCIQCKTKYTNLNKEHRLDYVRSKKGVCITIYNSQKTSSKRRGHNPPEYSRDDFISWLLSQKIFHKLYDDWVKSNYDRWMKPSCDRIKDEYAYSFDNIHVTTWLYNSDKNKLNPVVQLSDKFEFIRRFDSIKQASELLKIHNSGISRVCKNKNTNIGRVYAGGFRWIYAKDYYGNNA